MKKLLTLCAALVAAAPLAAQTTQLTPAKDRISDQAIQTDHQAYEALQGRIKSLNDSGKRPVGDYFLSKAQCWLDVSFHEYTRNDRSAFPQEAMTESEKLIVGMESSGVLSLETPLVNNAAKLRDDLWQRAALLKGKPELRCSAQALACAEVELVHAGNEYNQQQWRHAKPYIQIAEELFQRADQQAKDCADPPRREIIVERIVEKPVEKIVEVIVEKPQTEVAVNVVFNFDKHTYKDIRPFSVVQLEGAVKRIQNEKLDVRSIRLIGHADRLNSTGIKTYNETLSEKRVQTVKAAMIKLGIDPALITTDHRGDRQQIEGCEARFKSKTELEECLLPNRRVEVLIDARKK